MVALDVFNIVPFQNEILFSPISSLDVFPELLSIAKVHGFFPWTTLATLLDCPIITWNLDQESLFFYFPDRGKTSRCFLLQDRVFLEVVSFLGTDGKFLKKLDIFPNWEVYATGGQGHIVWLSLGELGRPESFVLLEEGRADSLTSQLRKDEDFETLMKFLGEDEAGVIVADKKKMEVGLLASDKSESIFYTVGCDTLLSIDNYLF
jgi:hypothetical protein